MFNRTCFDDIRLFEAALYEGPETPEKIYEREESYQSPHENRRSLKRNLDHRTDSNTEERNAWYKLVYLPEENKVVRKFFDDEERECAK